jgi:hypothetical protein
VGTGNNMALQYLVRGADGVLRAYLESRGRGAQQESRGLTLKGQPRRVRILISMRAAGLGVAAVATV